jgi:hypothetical protein
MRLRCLNPNSNNYSRYGGAGITICDRWNSFENFLEDMGERPAGTTIDRKNNKLGYEPGNCRWVTKKEQARNRDGFNIWVNCFGVSMLISDVARGLKIQISTLRRRVNKGMTWQEAFDESISQICYPSTTKNSRAPFGVPGVYKAYGGKFRVYKLGAKKANQVGLFDKVEDAIALSKSINV